MKSFFVFCMQVFKTYFLLIVLIIICISRVEYFYKFEAGKLLGEYSIIYRHPYFEKDYQVVKTFEKTYRVEQYPLYRFGQCIKKSENKSYLTDLVVNKNCELFLSREISELRQFLIDRVKSSMAEPYSSLVLGFSVGYKANYPSAFLNNLKNAGVMHMLVVSGFNVSILLSVFEYFTYKSAKLIFFTLLFFVSLALLLMVGFEAPVIRACATVLLVFLARIQGCIYSTVYLTSFVGLLMLLVNPYYIIDLSFLFTFIATYSVFLYTKIFNLPGLGIIAKKDFFKNIIINSYVSITLACISCYYFEVFAFGSVISGIILMDIISVLTILSLVYVLFPNFLFELFLVGLNDFFIFLISSLGQSVYLNYSSNIALVNLVCIYILIFLSSFLIRKI